MATLKSSIFSVVLLAFSFAAEAQDYSNIEFIENKGQWDRRVRYMGEINSGAIFIRNTGFTILQHQPDEYALIQRMAQHPDSAGLNAMRRADGKLTVNSHAWNVDFVGASPQMRLVPDKSLPTYNNYFLGNDPSKWASECKIYQAMTLENVYPNVDVRYYTYNGMLKYDIVARPGADISKIALRYEGVDKIDVKNKELVLKTSLGERRESSPYTYQLNGKERMEVSCKYVIKGDLVTFDVKGYDRNSTLVIDPTLIFCSLSNSTATNWGFTATYGPDGSFYGGAIVFSGNSFPVSPGAFQTVYQGGVGSLAVDIGIIRLTANGSNRIFATYIGGSGNEQPHSLIVDPSGNVIIAGRSNSTSSTFGSLFPTTGSTIGSGGGYDIAIVKLSANGSTLLGSRLIGGSGDDGVNIQEVRGGTISLQQNYGDDGRSEVILDAANNIYVASCTRSANFPVNNGFQASSGGGQDAVLIKMDPNLAGATAMFSSYLGGDKADAAYVLSLAPNGDIFVAGGTESGNFPGNHTGTIGPASNGGIDGFIAQVSNNGSTLIRSTYVGTSGIDQIYGIQFDLKGFVYIMGQTTGDMPLINSGYNSQTVGKQFIGKLQPDLSAYVYRTRFGTNGPRPNISPTAFLVDRCENVYVSGWGGSISGSTNIYLSGGTTGMETTADALQRTTDGKDFYFFVLKKDAAGLLYASFFGQSEGFTDHVDGGTSRFDRNGVIYQGVCANCNGGAIFPTTPGVWGPVKPASAACNLGMIKIAFNLAGVGANVRAEIGGVVNDTAGCVPLDVSFTDMVRNAREYIWDFGDGTPQVGPIAATAGGYQQTHTYTSTGTFRVMLIAIDPASCNERDTVYMNIRVGDLEANLRANVVKLDPCDAFNYRFDNLSTTDPSRPFTDTSFTWNFGDGSPRVRGGLASVTHAYAAPGTYNAWLILNDTSYCNNPDSIQIVVRVSANVDASFDAPPIGCAPDNVAFTYTGTGGQTFEWDFGDPASGSANTSALANPTHVYQTPGTYTIRLIVIDPNTCNVRDTVFGTINVFEKPTANFLYSPTTPVVNTPHVFTNTSSVNAVRFKWDFGDGTILETTSRNNITHQFNATGKFNVCLIAFTESGCSDTLCEPVSAIVVPKLDVPNAFTPNSGDINSTIMVKGFGIAKMRFIIWNRWGQKVFETNNPLQGWDGRVKGVVQPMDVYAYTLDVEFFDGTKATKKGDITLIR
jgi:gliding motility-associated-like protein